MRRGVPTGDFVFPKPGKVTLWLMVAIGCWWLIFALGMNWAGAGNQLFYFLIGDTDAVLSGQVWRLFTATVMHHPKSPAHPLFVCLLLYFFATPMEQRWGGKRLLAFLFGTGAIAYLVQILIDLIVPQLEVRAWYGGMVMADAVAVAWAFAFRDQTVRLFFVLPIKPMWMVGFIAAWSLLNNIIATNPDPEGTIAPFAALGAGYLFCESSPLRRFFLKLKLWRLQSEVSALSRGVVKKRRRRNNGGPDLRVIRGGDDDDKPMLH